MASKTVQPQSKDKSFFALHVALRVIIGLLFVLSGFEKLIEPHQNFLYVVQGYDLFDKPLDMFVVRILPWFELLLGIFVVLGLWLSESLKGLWVMTACFIIVVAQAVLRKLPITDCGCFGGLMVVPLTTIT